MDKSVIEVIKNDDKLKGLIEELKANKSITKEEAYKEIIAYLASKDINVTSEDIDEFLKNNYKSVLSHKMSDQELDTINGGAFDAPDDNCFDAQHDCHFGSGYSKYPVPDCSATVEHNSWCGSDDQCMIWDVVYGWKPR